MSYLLDTNICIYWLKGNDYIEKSAITVGLENISISFITLAELYYGVYKSQRINDNLTAINLLADKLLVVESNDIICASFGSLKALLEKEGEIIDDADLFIKNYAEDHGRKPVGIYCSVCSGNRCGTCYQ